MLYIFQYPLCILITDCADFTGSKARLLESRKKKRHILTSGKFHFTAHSVEITSKYFNLISLLISKGEFARLLYQISGGVSRD